MRTEQCVSVTELSKNTSGIIRRAPDMGAQYVFVNNKPQAVILGMRQFEIMQKAIVEFWTVDYAELSIETKQMLDKAKTQSRESFIDY